MSFERVDYTYLLANIFSIISDNKLEALDACTGMIRVQNNIVHLPLSKPCANRGPLGVTTIMSNSLSCSNHRLFVLT